MDRPHRSWYWGFVRRDNYQDLLRTLRPTMIDLQLSETEALSLLIAARGAILRFENEQQRNEEAYLELVKAAEKLEQQLWGPVNAG